MNKQDEGIGKCHIGTCTINGCYNTAIVDIISGLKCHKHRIHFTF